MKYLKLILIICFLIVLLKNSYSQVDTSLVNNYYEKALSFDKQNQLDTAIVYYNKTIQLTFDQPENYKIWATKKHLYCLDKLISLYFDKYDSDYALMLTDSVILFAKDVFGDSTQFVANAYHRRGFIYFRTSKYNQALENYFISLSIRKKNLGERNLEIASSYYQIGQTYADMAEYNKALDYYFKSLEIRHEILGEKHKDISSLYGSIGNIYYAINELDKGLEYHFKSITIANELFGEKNVQVAFSYMNIGNIYYAQAEFDKSLEYYFKSLNINMGILGEKHPDLARAYGNIANVYTEKKDYTNALEYYFKCLEIFKDKLSEKQFEVALTLANIGNVYLHIGDYNKALEYNLKALEVQKELFGENHLNLTSTLFNIGNIYVYMAEYNKALECYFVCLKILHEQVGVKSVDAAMIYNNMGEAYSYNYQYEKALKSYHLGAVACLYDYNDTTNLFETPPVERYLSQIDFLYNLLGKAKSLAVLSDFPSSLNGFTKSNILEIALKHYQAADTLIDHTRKKFTALGDKLNLGEIATQTYEGAIRVCIKLDQISENNNKERFAQMAFYFSEKNKSQALLQALSGQEAQKFAGIPDSLLQHEQNLKSEISSCEQNIAQGVDSITEILFRDKLFAANRKYEELISNFEKRYPEYYSLKYSTKNPTVKQLQNLLDTKSAIRSYFVGDSTIYIFTISNKKFDVQQVAKIDNLEDTIRFFRYGLTKFSQRMTDVYRRTGVLLYNQLFPETFALDKSIENLIIIPDGALATIPFEALLSQNPANINSDDYKNYPFLIKQYNVSYSYSANLFYRTFPKDKQKQPELTNINDWLALAPIFDDKSEQGFMLATCELQKQINNLQTDTLNVRGRLLTGDYITPLPGTETETQAIIKEYENRNLKAQALLHKSANEQFVKSGGLEKYKIIHFATHGFVNSEKPELSGILLAQDSTGNQDGILYSGEIYNLKFNADLVVLSACETGLGKINKGEGIIGLTRALLYAGSKNIIVSLWQVSDESTSDLMIDFYDNLLNTKSTSFSDPLRKSKLNMISEGKFAHPFYWSPFILVGK